MFFFFKQKTAYEMRISDWSSDVCSSDLPERRIAARAAAARDVIGALRRLGQRKELLRLVPGALDQRRVDAMIGDHREAEALEGGAEILREPVDRKSTRLNSSH